MTSDDLSDRLERRLKGFLHLFGALALSALVVPPVVVAVAGLSLLYGPFPGGDLPEERPMLLALPSVVLDGNGNEIGELRGFDRTVEVTPEQVPDVMNQAVVAIEDQRFWTHNGVDLEGIARAAKENLELGEVSQGGSTITQQYVKNVYLSRERTFERKIEEALLAVELEKRMTKEEILFGYLSTSYFGDGAYGIGAAAEVYFNKPLDQLDPSEAATLAGLLQAPTALSPRSDVEAAEERRVLVLEAMREQGYLDDDEHRRHVARHLWVAGDSERPEGTMTTIVPRQPKGALDYPYFVDLVEADLVERFGPDLVYRGGLTIETTIDPDLQSLAESVVAARLEGTEYPVEMSLASVDPRNGHIVAMVGGRDYEASQVNLGTGGSTGFQPGSSFKPIVLAAAMEQGIGPDTVYPAPGVWSPPGCGASCSIANYDGAGRGAIPLREAMRASVNTVFAQLVLDVSIDGTIEMAQRLGLERIDPGREYGASLSLGVAETSPLEMASAFGVFANRGVRLPATPIARVIDHDGNVLVDNRAPAGEQVIDQAVADNISDVLVGVIAGGTGRAASLGDRPAAGKTGTAQSYSAAWFAGYTPQLSTAVWMGHADGLRPLHGINGVGSVTGGSHPAVAWGEFMNQALAGTEVIPFPEPAPIEGPSNSDNGDGADGTDGIEQLALDAADADAADAGLVQIRRSTPQRYRTSRPATTQPPPDATYEQPTAPPPSTAPPPPSEPSPPPPPPPPTGPAPTPGPPPPSETPPPPPPPPPSDTTPPPATEPPPPPTEPPPPPTEPPPPPSEPPPPPSPPPPAPPNP